MERQRYRERYRDIQRGRCDTPRGRERSQTQRPQRPAERWRQIKTVSRGDPGRASRRQRGRRRRGRLRQPTWGRRAPGARGGTARAGEGRAPTCARRLDGAGGASLRFPRVCARRRRRDPAATLPGPRSQPPAEAPPRPGPPPLTPPGSLPLTPESLHPTRGF